MTLEVALLAKPFDLQGFPVVLVVSVKVRASVRLALVPTVALLAATRSDDQAAPLCNLDSPLSRANGPRSTAVEVVLDAVAQLWPHFDSTPP